MVIERQFQTGNETEDKRANIKNKVKNALNLALSSYYPGFNFIRSGQQGIEFYCDFDLEGSTISSKELPTLSKSIEKTLMAEQKDFKVENLSKDNFVLLSTSAVHVDSSKSDLMVQRINGAVFESKDEKEKYLKSLTEKKERNHIQIGRRLELFAFSEEAPGMPYWLPNGLKLKQSLLQFWREEHETRGYQEIASPLLNKISLYEKSGHIEHYIDNMFIAETKQGSWAAKPMNCPNAIFVYGLKERSYRELPLRISDCDILHRLENTGVLNGLLRVQEFQQDDAHIFVAPDQIEGEIKNILDIVERFYSVFDLKYSFRLSLRGKSYLGNTSEWQKAENILKDVLSNQKQNYSIAEGEGAFYGPKIDILMQDALEREWQMGTIQLDFQLPQRFDINYIDKDGTRKTPILLHRVVYGSLERFIGIITEHFGGAFPTWLAPEQVAILPVGPEDKLYADDLIVKLKSLNVRALTTPEEDLNKSVGKRIKEAAIRKIPYTLVVGNKELQAQSVSVRPRKWKEKGKLVILPKEEFFNRLQDEITNKSNELNISE